MKSKKSLTGTLAGIGEELSQLRMKKGYNTVLNFAIEHKLPPNQYWKIENGKANITIKTLLRLLAIHRVSLEDFFCSLKSAK